MVRVTVRYDGKVLIPENAVDLPTNVPLRITVHTGTNGPAEDAILGLDGLGAEIWEGVDPLEYQRQERQGWE
jgi:hypothetical protein